MAKSSVSFKWHKKRSILIKDKGFGKAFYKDVGEIFRQEMNDFVPYLSGNLANHTAIVATDKDARVEYRVPYAYVQYHGIGVNEENRTKSPHPLATSYWDKAAWTMRKNVIGKRVAEARRNHAK